MQVSALHESHWALPTRTIRVSNTCSLTGQQLAAVARKSGLDGIQIYSSPFCKNAWTCPRTSGDYATGIASIIRSFREAAPTLEISLLANLEWDHAEIIVTGDPSVIFSAQTA